MAKRNPACPARHEGQFPGLGRASHSPLAPDPVSRGCIAGMAHARRTGGRCDRLCGGDLAMNLKPASRSLLTAAVLVLCLGCGGGGGGTPTGPGASSDPNAGNTSAADRAGQLLSRGRCTGTDKPPLTWLPMASQDVAFILPYGLMVGGHVTPLHPQYFSPIVFDSAPGTYPVYAAADSTLHEITTRTHRGQGSYTGQTITDHRLVFSLS